MTRPRLAQAERAVSLALHPSRTQLLDIILHRHTAFAEHYVPPPKDYDDALRLLEELLREDPELAALVG